MRISMTQAIHHEWFTEQLKIRPPLKDQLEQFFLNIKKFQKFNFFKKVVLSVVARFLSFKEIEKATQLFQSIDKDKDGIISYPELRFYV